jgi:excisionase family DNA binding protein
MQPSSKPLYVRLAASESDRLDAAAAATGKSKRQLVSEAVSHHLDRDQLQVGRISLRQDEPEVMTLAEAAAFLRVDEAALEASAAQGKLPGRRIGGEWRFSRAAIMTWLGADAAADTTVPSSPK